VTARRYLQEDVEPGRRKATTRATPVLTKAAPRLEALLDAWSVRTTPKQHVTATALHKALVVKD
jgi:hypothetical protein